MTADQGPLVRAGTDAAGDESSREERHQVLATMLGAYADRELPLETSSQIDAHLLGCARCRRELATHRALTRRLESEPLVRASSALTSRVVTAIAAAPIPTLALEASSTSGRHWVPTRAQARVLAAIVVLTVAPALWLARGTFRADRVTPTIAATVVPLPSVALFADALADFRRVAAIDLPGRARDLAAVRAALPFPVRPLSSAPLRLLAAWTTPMGGDPAAVLAYRWHDRLLLHYVVSEQLLFRPSEVRHAFAAGHPLGARDGAYSVLAWPARESGELLVGEATPSQLAALLTPGTPR